MGARDDNDRINRALTKDMFLCPYEAHNIGDRAVAKTVYILRSIDLDGNVGYYTGKAGQEWVSPRKADAFGYNTLEGARNKAARFNEFEPIHGLWFLAGPLSQFKTRGAV